MNINIILSFLISLIVSFTTCNVSFAQVQNTKQKSLPALGKPQATPQPQATKPQAEVKKQESTSPTPQAQVQEQGKNTAVCNCQKPVSDIIDKSYVSLEEDEWPAAIKICTDALITVKNLSNTCTCLDAPLYKSIAQAFLNYAKGGDILDGEKDPNCQAANKLYTDAIKLLDEALPKIKDTKLKSNVESIRDYCKEELDFVKDECS